MNEIIDLAIIIARLVETVSATTGLSEEQRAELEAIKFAVEQKRKAIEDEWGTLAPKQ